MKIHLPNSAWLGNIDPFLRSIDFSKPETLNVTADKKWISVHPMILAIIASLAQTVPKGNILCEPFEARSAHYFERMKLFHFLGVNSDTPVIEHDPSGRFVPLTQIKNSEELSAFVEEASPLLHLESHYSESIRYIVSELLRNVIEHSESPQGAFVAAQYYPKSNTIRIGIADTGIGIRTSLAHSHKTQDDISAIRLALMPGITGTTRRDGGTTENAGAGLFFIKSIAAVNDDFFVIYSGNGFFKLLKQNISGSRKQRNKLHSDPFDDRHSMYADMPTWNGTAVGIDMALDDHEAFSTLLNDIRNTYGHAVRERKKARYKKPLFI
ncbi:MAG TPA: ATP-binding protein [Ignavibacteria bacterium]|nr:ATP-binding protein [Ignavibacteria bacterium]